MNTVARLQPASTIAPEIIANLVTTGDLSRLDATQRVQYYNYRCQQAGLDPAAKPFDILRLNGKEILYANASCTQQLCGIHKLSVEITSKDKLDDLYVVCARVKSPDGRASDNMGAVPLGNLKGEALANAMLKATTKAIRRAVLAHLGLGMLDETEVQTIPGAVVQEFGKEGDGKPTHQDMANQFVAALKADCEGTTEEEVETNRAAAVLRVHNAANYDEDYYRATWALLSAPDRRAIKAYIDMARKAAA